ncbi:MAG: BolA/IbaG family iron-sulfur metabolism protein [Gammaproteobacteria bacterium]|nr:BolA/IbaG family iron-sulfur metabolism protein [Gammaproteobacteria bacterium]MBQ0773520.1 BolA/IbaG family iron-sulfur metabolism protein [Gammaproteobacteria bacterium]
MATVMAQAIESKVRAGLSVAHFELDNESHMHNVPAGSESHFRLVVVSDDFDGLLLVRRHQRIYALLSDELAGEVHALAMHTFTPEEWAKRGKDAEASPACRGGSGQ